MDPQKPIRVYLVEDSPIILQRLIELIEPTGATVVGHADTASAAIADIAALHPDAVTVDITLKQGNGFDVLEAIAVNSEGHPPLCIVLTNYTFGSYRDAAHHLGADHFFDKAKQIPEVLTVLDSLNADRQSAIAA
ncbi:MAG TPA: response regulator [Casimicrobiaceae bacterium]|jgi:CheY-like chemotaxis protein